MKYIYQHFYIIYNSIYVNLKFWICKYDFFSYLGTQIKSLFFKTSVML